MCASSLLLALRRRLGLALAALLALAGPAAAAERVVAIGGSITEIVYALGAAEMLAAVDSTSLYPPAARDLPDVGYMRRLSAEPILALGPDLVLAIAEAGPPQVLDQLRSAGIPVETVADVPTPDGVLGKIRAVAGALGRAQAGEALAAKVAAGFAALPAAAAEAERPKVLFLLSTGRGAPLAGGQETTADGIIRLAGGRNAIEGFAGYKPLSPEAALAAAPDVILCMDRTVEQMGGAEAILGQPTVAQTPAGRARRLVSMDGLLLLGFGPRTPEAAALLAERLRAVTHAEAG